MGVSFPFGHLEFDDQTLTLWGIGSEFRVTKSQIEGVQLSRGILASRVSIVMADRSTSEVYFAALGRRTIRQALQERGWRVDG